MVKGDVHPSKIKNIIFDYGKVLVDYSLSYLYDSYFDDKEEMLWFFDHVVNADFHHRLDMGVPTAECVADLQQEFPQYAEQLAAYDTHYMRLLGNEIPGMRELLRDLRHHGLHLYGLTNWGIEKFSIVRRHFEIFQLLDGEVVSGVEHVVKPYPPIFQILLDRYGLQAEECLFTDDRADNVEGARAMGMQGVVFENAVQLRDALVNYGVIL